MKKAKFKIGDKIRVLSGGKPLETVIENITEDTNTYELLYWFKDERNTLWWELGNAIELRKDD